MANKDTTDDQQRESSSPLPSYGLSKLCDITNPDTVTKVMDGLSQGNLNLETIQRVHNQDANNENANAASDESQGNTVVMYYDTQGQLDTGGKMKVESENSYVQLQMYFGNLGNTECIQQQLQVSDTGITEDQLFGEGDVAMEVTVVEGILEPSVTFTDVAKYSRFRYESERTKTPRSKKCNNLDHSEDYKNLGTLKIEGYHGRASLVIFCVDGQGRIHPYSLHGEHCEDGIYQRHFDDLNSVKIIKLNKVTFTTPKSKQYKDIFQKRRHDLRQLSIDTESMQNTDMEKSDKNTVYLHAEVIFDDAQTRKSTMSTAIHNKKEGHEFKIYTIEPASAPATGANRGNPNKNRVLIVLTEATACPKNLAVKIKSRTGQPWETIITQKKLKVIKRCVVEFYPPAFGNPDTDVNEECDITLVDIETNDETDPVTFVYHSVKDLEGLEERRRKKPRLDPTSKSEVLRQITGGASNAVLQSLDQSKKRPRAVSGTRPSSTEMKHDIPRYTDVYLDKSNATSNPNPTANPNPTTFPNPTTNEKVYSLKDGSQNQAGTSRQVVHARENGGGSNVASGLFPQQREGGGYERPMLQENQIELSLPSNTTNWQAPNQSNLSLPTKPTNWEVASYESQNQQSTETTNWQGMSYRIQNSSASAQTVSCAVVTSTSNFSVERPSVATTTLSTPLSAGFQPSFMSTPVAFPPTVSQATATFLPTMKPDLQQLQQTSNMQQLQALLQQMQQPQQIETPSLPDHERQKVMLQKQAEEISQREKQVQAREQMLQERMQQMATEQQSQQQMNQQSQQIQHGMSDSNPQTDQTKEKRLKFEFLSAYFEREAQKMNPGFKLPPGKMFLLLDDKISIADRSLVDIVFPSGTQSSLNVDSLLQTLANQSTASPLGGATIYSQPVQSAKLVSQSATAASQYGSPTVAAPPQYVSTNQATAYQAPPLAQQPGLPQLQNMSAQQGSHNNPYNIPANIQFQQFPTGAPQFQLGTSAGAGNQQHSALGQGTRNPQSSGQSGKSIFPRNNLPFSAANLDDDDVEIDSEGPKRKKPIQLYGKTAKKQANGSNMKNGLHTNNGLSMNNGSNMNNTLNIKNGLNLGKGLPRQEEPVVIDLTVDNKHKNSDLNTDLNDNDLETDCFELKMNKLSENGGTVKDDLQMDRFSKIDNSKKLPGLHVGGKVQVENDLNEEVGHAKNSGVSSMV